MSQKSNRIEYYAPIALSTTKTLQINNEIEVDLDLRWADGMVGVIPMFESIEAAKKYAGADAEIMMFEGPPLEEADNVEETTKAE
jgi:hypothetical protein